MRMASRLKDTGSPGTGVEDRHAHRGGFDQRLQAGPGPPFLPVPSGVGDGQGRLGGEQRQGLLVLRGELLPALLLGQEDAAHPLAQVQHRGRQEGDPGAHRQRRRHLGQTLVPQVAQQVGDPQGAGELAQVPEVLRPARYRPHPFRLVLGHARGEEVPGVAGLVVQGDDAVAGAGEGAGGVQDALQHRVEVQGLVDAQAGLAEQGQALPQGPVLAPQVVGRAHLVTSCSREHPQRRLHRRPGAFSGAIMEQFSIYDKK